MELSIPASPPFRFSHNLDYLARSADECLYRLAGDKVIRLVRVEGHPYLIEVRGEGVNVHIRILAGQTENEEAAGVIRYVREWLDTDQDLGPFYDMARQDPLLRQLVERFEGLRLIGVPDLFEALGWAILGQQITLSFAYTLKKRFVEAFGSSVTHDGWTYWGFPEPELVARLSVHDLTPLQISSKKAEYMIGVAKLLVEGELSKASLLQIKEPKLIEKRLTDIHGIGPWTAHYVMMRCLRVGSAFPLADVGLHNAIKKLQDRPDKPSIAEMKALAARWSGHEAYSAFYLWRWLY